MKVLLLGLEFNIGNKGCEALAYSFVNIMQKLSLKLNIRFEYRAILYVTEPVPYVPGTDIPIICEKISYKHPKFWMNSYKAFKESDIIFDFTMGDSFADIYGIRRFWFMTMLKQTAIWSKTPFILGPQTYGPYEHKLIRLWAKSIINHSREAFTRDAMSAEYVRSIGGRDVIQTTDVAFALPFEKKEGEFDRKKIHVGFNPSGLLWDGGYTHNNQFHLAFDYQQYCYEVLDFLCNHEEYVVHLIPHVGDATSLGKENDYNVCKILKERYPSAVIPERFETAMDVKGYIAQMDVFIGARMHATIGAFSSGVATIPFSYSRKFEGLYHSLNYPYMISAQITEKKEAVELTLKYISERDKLKENVQKSMMEVRNYQNEFENDLEKIILSIK